jgi:hypothetical protein
VHIAALGQPLQQLPQLLGTAARADRLIDGRNIAKD